MHTKKKIETVDAIVAGAIRREKQLLNYYEGVLEDVGPDARALMVCLCAQQSERIIQLEQLLDEIGDLRELAAPIAD